jgi:hypothetical protein
MTEPVYFAVVRRNGVESPRLFFERVPPDFLRKDSPLVYCTRLDTLPGAMRMITSPLDDLFWLYRKLRDRGKLPVENRGPKPKPAEA